MRVGRERGLQREDGEGRFLPPTSPPRFVEDWITGWPPLGAHTLDLVMTHTSVDLTPRPGEGSKMLAFKLRWLPFTEAGCLV